MKALIVEPSRFSATILSNLLLKNGIEADIVTSGKDGLAALTASPYDLMCFAYALGDMTGNDFYLKAKLDSLVGNFPALMITSGVDRRDIQRALSMGVSECIPKSKLAQAEKIFISLADRAQEQLYGRVLLVEDSQMTAAQYKQLLTRIGLHVDHHTNAEDALKALRLRHYDLMVTDFILVGEQTGLWLIRKLRDSGWKNKNIPILAVSGFEEPARKIEILRAGANDFVAKPVLNEELELRVRHLFKTEMLMRRLEMQYLQMRDFALHDQLTGLYNRHYLHDRIPQLFAHANAKKVSFALMLIDIDHFKKINDTYGHSQGDLVLEAVAQVILDSGRGDAIAARLGGEEFLLLQPDLDLVRAVIRAEGMRHRIEALRPSDICVTASMGVVVRNENESFEHMLQRADLLVYKAKDQGRNQVVVD